MLDNLLSERVEKWKNKALFERKSVALKDLNKEMEEGSKELDMLLKKKKKLYDASGKDEDEDDRDAEDPLANLDGNENSADFKGRTERLAVRLQIREAESSIDGITRDLDLLNTDLEDLADKVAFYLHNHDARHAIIQKGYQQVQNFTLTKQLKNQAPFKKGKERMKINMKKIFLLFFMIVEEV